VSRRLAFRDAQRAAHRDHAGERGQQLGMAVPRYAGDPDDLARADRKADIAQPWAG
jgi:hypothetical protein